MPPARIRGRSGHWVASDSAARVCVAGITGWIGQPVAAAIEAASGPELVAGVSRQRGAHVVVGSSGLSESDYDEIDALAREKEVV